MFETTLPCVFVFLTIACIIYMFFAIVQFIKCIMKEKEEEQKKTKSLKS